MKVDIAIDIYDGDNRVATIKWDGQIEFHTQALTADNLREIADIKEENEKSRKEIQ